MLTSVVINFSRGSGRVEKANSNVYGNISNVFMKHFKHSSAEGNSCSEDFFTACISFRKSKRGCAVLLLYLHL